jgi:hypothetical protein
MGTRRAQRTRGIAVGDPVMANTYQYPTYPTTLHGMGVVMEDERDEVSSRSRAASQINTSLALMSRLHWHDCQQLSTTCIGRCLHCRPLCLTVLLMDQLAALFQKATALQEEGNCWESFQLWNSVWNDDGGFRSRVHHY